VISTPDVALGKNGTLALQKLSSEHHGRAWGGRMAALHQKPVLGSRKSTERRAFSFVTAELKEDTCLTAFANRE
jgi:hypothetical protein